MRRTCRRAGAVRMVVLVLFAGISGWWSGGPLRAQQQFELFVAAVDERTQWPATDLTAADFLVTENGQPGRVVRVEPYSVPVRLTILVDNGAGLFDLRTVGPSDPPPQGLFAELLPSRDVLPLERRGVQESLVHFRRGLQALIEALPGDLEVDVIALSPNPRFLARPTSDRVQLLRSVQLLTPEDQFPSRFSDGLVEYAQRLERDLRGERAVIERPYVPALVAIGSTGLDGSEPRRDDLNRMLESMARYGVRTHFAMLTRHAGPMAVNNGFQVIVAKAIQELTGGEYVPLAVPTRAETLLPEWGAQLALRHRLGTSQYRVTIERPAGVTGPLSELSVYVRREGYSGVVTIDGRVP